MTHLGVERVATSCPAGWLLSDLVRLGHRPGRLCGRRPGPGFGAPFLVCAPHCLPLRLLFRVAECPQRRR